VHARACQPLARYALERHDRRSLAQPSYYMSFGRGPSKLVGWVDVRDLGRSRPSGKFNLFVFPSLFE
jgi:hypothetical protein